jgi:tetratricopeptide (TPR) repeat protein
VLRVALALLVVASVSCKDKTPPPRKVSPPSMEEAEAFAKKFASSASPCDPAAIDAVFDQDTLVRRAVTGHKFSSRQFEQLRREAKSAIGKSLCQQLEHGSYTYLRTQLVDGTPRPLFRVVDDSGGFNYHQLELDKQGAEIRAVDLYIYVSGENMSETFGNLAKALVEAGNLKTNMSMQKMRKLMASGEYAEARQLLQELPAELRKTKAAMLIAVELSSESTEDPAYLAAIDAYAKAFPNDPSLDIVLLDGMFLRKKYAEALAIIDRLDKRVGGDAYLEVLRANMHIEGGKQAEGIAAAKRATERERTLEAAWWQLLTAQAVAKDYAAALTTLDVLQKEFDADFDQETLSSDERFTGLAASKEFEAWSGDAK